MDVEHSQALHGRAPSVATGAKRMRPECLLFAAGRRRHGERRIAGG
ncbi:MAG: hypothetical protein R3E53_07900 [Myxococcota bacterium]